MEVHKCQSTNPFWIFHSPSDFGGPHGRNIFLRLQLWRRYHHHRVKGQYVPHLEGMMAWPSFLPSDASLLECLVILWRTVRSAPGIRSSIVCLGRQTKAITGLSFRVGEEYVPHLEGMVGTYRQLQTPTRSITGIDICSRMASDWDTMFVKQEVKLTRPVSSQASRPDKVYPSTMMSNSLLRSDWPEYNVWKHLAASSLQQ